MSPVDEIVWHRALCVDWKNVLIVAIANETLRIDLRVVLGRIKEIEK